MWSQPQPHGTRRQTSSPRAAACERLLPSFSALPTHSASHSPASSSASWGSARSQRCLSDDVTTHRLSLFAPQAAALSHHEMATALSPAVAPVQSRALTSSERGRRFRLREKAHEQSLMKQLTQIREQIAQLESSRDLVRQRSFMTRTSSGGSLEKMVRELYAVFQFGLETLDAADRTSIYSKPDDQLAAIVDYKENYMRRAVDQDVCYGDLVGVDLLLDQWRKHTLSTSRFEIEIVRVEPIAGSKANPIVVIHSKQHARYSRDTLPVMFPGALERRPDLARKFIGRDITFDCITRFTFSKRGQITIYSLNINFVEAFVKTVGSARDVAELMAFSVVTPFMVIQDVVPPGLVQASTFEPLYEDGSSEGDLARGDQWDCTSDEIAPYQQRRHGHDDRVHRSISQPQRDAWMSGEESDDSTRTYICRV